MPELPEVETVRAGLERHVVGRTITDVTVLSDRAVRHEVAGAEGITTALLGRRIAAAVRRGKFCWLPLGSGAEVRTALLLHLGMSGQMLVSAAGDERAAGGERGAGGDRGAGSTAQPGRHPHLRIRATLDDGSVLDFVDQRTFGYWRSAPLVATADGHPGGAGSELRVVPAPVAHIARDLLDPAFDASTAATVVRRRSTTLKRALLDQQWVSGVGNIYADESLWVARLHGDLPVAAVGHGDVVRLLDAAAAVMRSAVAAGGTSFDALYVNVNGQSGYFDRSLAVYGKAGQPCRRCGAAVVRQRFANRSSYFCPVCQPSPSP